MRGLIFALFLTGCGSDYEARALAYCADKGGVKGYSVRYRFNVLHCNNGKPILLEEL